MISSLADTWISLESVDANGESDRVLKIIKSRGMPHSNQIREFEITSTGIKLIPPYIGPSGVLTGSARLGQELKEREEGNIHAEQIEMLKRQLERQTRAFDFQLESLKLDFSEKETELKRQISEKESKINRMANDRDRFLALRLPAAKEGSRDVSAQKKRRKKRSV
jgi:circadian clock protein KaiC